MPHIIGINITSVLSLMISLLMLAGCGCQKEVVPQYVKRSSVGRTADLERGNKENRILELVYPISIHEMRDILGKEDPMDPFYDPKTAGPLELLERAGVPMRAVEVVTFDGLKKSIIFAPCKTHKIIESLIKREPYSNDPA